MQPTPSNVAYSQGTHHRSIRRRRWRMVRGGLRGSWWNEAAHIASRRRRHDGRRGCLEATRCAARDDWPKTLVVFQGKKALFLGDYEGTMMIDNL